MKTNYIEQRLDISENQKEKVKRAMQNNEAVTIRVENIGDDIIALTETQINKINKAFEQNKAVNIKLSKQQLKYNKEHVTGGFIGALLAGLSRFALPLLSKALPALGVGALSGVASNLVNKVMGNGLYMKRGDHIVKVKEFGNGIYLKPQQTNELQTYGNGVYLKRDGELFEGSGVIHELAKNIPILNLLF